MRGKEATLAPSLAMFVIRPSIPCASNEPTGLPHGHRGDPPGGHGGSPQGTDPTGGPSRVFASEKGVRWVIGDVFWFFLQAFLERRELGPCGLWNLLCL